MDKYGTGQILFFLPEIFRLTTGGNVYNKNIIRNLSEKISVTTVTAVESDDISSGFLLNAHGNIGDGTVLLVDSLFMKKTEDLNRIVQSLPTLKKVLMVHYLNVLDPYRRHSKEAADEKKWLSVFDACIATSDYAKSQLSRYGLNQDRIVMARPGVNTIFNNRKPLKDGPPVNILTVSSFFPGKGLIEMIPVLESLSHLSWEWLVVGEQELDENYTLTFNTKIKRSPIGSRVHAYHAVSQEELVEIYQTSQIFLLPSFFETCSMVTMEAMRCGLPIVAFRCGGIPEFVRDQQNGYLVKVKDMVALKDSLSKLLTDDRLREKFGQQSVRISDSFPGWDQTARTIFEFLNHLYFN